MTNENIEDFREIALLSLGITHALDCENHNVMREMIRSINNELANYVGAVLREAKENSTTEDTSPA